MTPRSYVQGRRAEAATATRERVIAAAAELYRERRIAGATLQAIAQRADVSRGTILNHFGGTSGLLEAVLDHVMSTLDLPDERVFEGAADVDERIRRFVDALLRFYDRTAEWWEVFGSEMDHPTLQARETTFWVAIGRAQAAALGPLAKDRLVAAAVTGFVHPAMLGTMRAAGATLEEVVEIIRDAIVDMVRRRADLAPSGAS